jgi:hypothetical protein
MAAVIQMRIHSALAILSLLCAPAMFGQNTSQEGCNEKRTFCWHSDEVEAWGELWKSDDPSKKPLEQVTEVRCVKKLHVCIKARNQQRHFGLPSLTNIDLYNVRSWDHTQIRAVMDEALDSECEQDTLLVNLVEQSATLISSPGPQGNEKHCTNFIGPPKTVVWRLINPEMDKLINREK